MSTLPAPLRERLTEGFGRVPEHVKSVAGGCINETATIRVGANVYFVKWNDDAPDGFFEAEAHGLNTLRDTLTIRVPEPLSWAKRDGDCPAFMVMEHISAPTLPVNRDTFGRTFGEQLAALHSVAAGTGGFGLDRDNFIGSLPQPNPDTTDWLTFLREHRIAPQLKRARDNKALRERPINKLERLIARLPDLIPSDAAPSLLHGDLWSGNYMVGASGEPVLVDPAVYWGHREVELAFTELFGGFPATMYSAYNAVLPLDPGYSARRGLYQIYPLLVHVNLFGGAYVRELEEAINPYI